MSAEDDVELALAGKKLYGNDFEHAAIEAWYDEEREGYANLGARDRASYRYVYHELNWRHGYVQLPNTRWPRVLGFGSAYGDELKPIIKRIDHITIVDPSAAFKNESIDNVPCKYVTPDVSGRLPFEDKSFNLITCFGVLHHIPNVSLVCAELRRVLRNDGYAIIREPIVSMGDWRCRRNGLTKNERGIPLPIFEQILVESGFTIAKRSLCDFAPTRLLFRWAVPDVYNSRFVVGVDAILARATARNWRYHARYPWHKLRPASCCFVLKRLT